MHAALAAQQARRLDDADRLYRAALAIAPDEPDALHMLGVVRYERGDFVEARQLIIRALDLTGWGIAAFRHNLGLVIARQYEDRDRRAWETLQRDYRTWVESRRQAWRRVAPRVTVVIPSYNHARFVGEALKSLYGQTYRNVEVIVVDDGSLDGSAEIIAAVLRDCPFPHRFVVRENRGAAATINEGIAFATGEFVNVLNSDDRFSADRLEKLVDAIACVGGEWGFGGVTFVGSDGRPLDALCHRRVFELTCALAAVPYRDSVGLAFLPANVAVSSGNLFIARRLVERVGGFRDYRYNHDWDFCLRAVMLAEPVFVPDPLYEYRLHDSNTIAESSALARAEGEGIGGEFLRAATEAGTASNPWAPTLSVWGPALLTSVLRSGMGAIMDARAIRVLALRAIEDAKTAPAAG